ncbi:hypothetical protein E2P81_ATG06029 [Venturia nashicola]|nr:hypothetical protein E2P81_ATG06029 [Venturia nashicola]
MSAQTSKAEVQPSTNDVDNFIQNSACYQHNALNYRYHIVGLFQEIRTSVGEALKNWWSRILWHGNHSLQILYLEHWFRQVPTMLYHSTGVRSVPCKGFSNTLFNMSPHVVIVTLCINIGTSKMLRF